MQFKTLSLLTATAALLLFPSVVPAQSSQLSTQAPGVVILDGSADLHELAAGATFETRLLNTVHLSNGKEISRGSTVIGTVVSKDDMDIAGQSKMILQFNSATKNGDTIPIRATITAVSTDFQPVRNDALSTEAVMAIPSNLSGQTDKVKQDVDNHMTLYSDAASENSGVIASDQDNIKLPDGTKFQLAIAPGQ